MIEIKRKKKEKTEEVDILMSSMMNGSVSATVTRLLPAVELHRKIFHQCYHCSNMLQGPN